MKKTSEWLGQGAIIVAALAMGYYCLLWTVAGLQEEDAREACGSHTGRYTQEEIDTCAGKLLKGETAWPAPKSAGELAKEYPVGWIDDSQPEPIATP